MQIDDRWGVLRQKKYSLTRDECLQFLGFPLFWLPRCQSDWQMEGYRYYVESFQDTVMCDKFQSWLRIFLGRTSWCVSFLSVNSPQLFTQRALLRSTTLRVKPLIGLQDRINATFPPSSKPQLRYKRREIARAFILTMHWRTVIKKAVLPGWAFFLHFERALLRVEPLRGYTVHNFC